MLHRHRRVRHGDDIGACAGGTCNEATLIRSAQPRARRSVLADSNSGVPSAKRRAAPAETTG